MSEQHSFVTRIGSDLLKEKCKCGPGEAKKVREYGRTRWPLGTGKKFKLDDSGVCVCGNQGQLGLLRSGQVDLGNILGRPKTEAG